MTDNAERQQARCRVCDREIPLSTAASGEHKSVSDIFRENGYPPMDDERRARVEATQLEGLQRDDTAAT